MPARTLSDEADGGVRSWRYWDGTASWRADIATSFSIVDGLSRELKPRRIVTHPNAPAPAMATTVIDRRRMRLLMGLPVLWACAHLEWNVHLTHRLVDSAWLRRRFETVRE